MQRGGGRNATGLDGRGLTSPHPPSAAKPDGVPGGGAAWIAPTASPAPRPKSYRSLRQCCRSPRQSAPSARDSLPLRAIDRAAHRVRSARPWYAAHHPLRQRAAAPGRRNLRHKIGCCRRKRAPSICLARREFQSLRSASLMVLRKARVRSLAMAQVSAASRGQSPPPDASSDLARPSRLRHDRKLAALNRGRISLPPLRAEGCAFDPGGGEGSACRMAAGRRDTLIGSGQSVSSMRCDTDV
jgi:hypothetical protein